MAQESQLVIVDHESNRNAIVLTIASPSRNSVTQLYPERVQMSARSMEDLHRKLSEKLRLHQIFEIRANFSINFENDRTVAIDSIEQFCRLDDKIDLLTHVVNARWSFVFDPFGGGDEHVHSISVRISERPNPALIFQRFVSGRTEDLDSFDGEAFAPISCKIDFIENRFSTELLAVVTEWVNSLPKAEPTFGIARWLNKHSQGIAEYIYGTFPPLVMMAAVGVWMAFLPSWMNSSIKIAVAWIMFSGSLFLLARYFAGGINRLLEKHLRRICTVPVFQITSGDKNRMTKYLAKSQKSLFALAAGGLVFGIFKGIGLWLIGVLIARAFT